MMRVELRAKKLCIVYMQFTEHVKLSSSSHTQNTPRPHHQSMKLRTVTNSMKTKVLFKFGASEMMCVELRAKKLYIVYVQFIPNM